MSISPRFLQVAAVALGASIPYVQAQDLTVTLTQVPTTTIGAGLEIRGATVVRGLNDAGQYVGTFGERNWVIWAMPHAFIHGSTGFGTGPGTPDGSYGRWGGYRVGRIEGSIRPDADYRYLDLFPAANSDFNAQVTYPNAISNTGLVVGHIGADEYDAQPHTAFVYQVATGNLTLLNVPGAKSAEATDVNDAGDVVGTFIDTAGGSHGFLYRAGTFTTIDLPGEVGKTVVTGINANGVIVGSNIDPGNTSSFILSNGAFQVFSVAGQKTYADDINDRGEIVGWVGISGERRAFYYSNGNGFAFDLTPDGQNTRAMTINNQGLIGGMAGSTGFLATISSPVPEPASSALMGAGLVGLLARLRRRRLPT